MKELLHEEGSIFVHCDWRMTSHIREILTELFGEENFVNEIIWQRTFASKSQTTGFGKVHETILYFQKSSKAKKNKLYLEPDDGYLEKYYNRQDPDGRRWQSVSLTQDGKGPERRFGDKVIAPPPGKHWIWSQDRIDKAMEDGIIYFTGNDFPRIKRYAEQWSGQGKPIHSLWTDKEVCVCARCRRIDAVCQ